MLKIGHRGARGYEPENTLISFQKALDMGVDGIELDVHLSADGLVVVIHDETVDRTTDGSGLVNEKTYEQLSHFRIEKNQNIPTLKEVLDLVDRKCFVNIELKGNGTAAPVVAMIQEYVQVQKWSYDDFIVSSFEWKMLSETVALDSNIPIAVLTETTIAAALDFAKKIKARAINPDFILLEIGTTEQLQREGFKVYPWTVNEIEDIKTIQNYGVDGIISDFPDRIQ
ncbi:glycerophosphodiester phosphodiesterase [Flavobacterium faecale]|uniref:Glycerophosphodiester phosphodiesterase n=1 Tax=Flavobacterium faecale TaxID=1355330 RepID=A0A2S1LBQ1_9FLAO|nr:glycerophosphodiester phosphodiesterase family protein [Flavobacterium faecale]AWG21179.1 glycerophosphodiester phosphodiesterase [Flavobacterium faecale]